MPFKRKREFAGGNPFVSRKKYKGSLFGPRKVGTYASAAKERKPIMRKVRRRRKTFSFRSGHSAHSTLKRSFGKKKAGTILKAVKEAVKDQNVSLYRKKLFGDFNPMWYYASGVGVPIGKKHLFTHFKKQTNSSPYTQYACEFSAFTPHKLIDAISVLFGGKAAAANQELTTGNLPNSTIGHFVYASQMFEMSNQTTRCYDIKIYELHNIGGCHSTPPLYDLNASIASHLWISAPSNTLAPANGECYIDDAFELSDLKMKSWKIAKVHKLPKFMPGATYSWSAQLKHKTINFEKMANSANQISTYGPGSIVYVIEAQTVLQLIYDATAANTTYGRVTPTNENSQSFGFNTKQVYSISEPENVADENEGVKTALFTDGSLGPAITPTGALHRYGRMATLNTETTAAV